MVYKVADVFYCERKQYIITDKHDWYDQNEQVYIPIQRRQAQQVTSCRLSLGYKLLLLLYISQLIYVPNSSISLEYYY